MMEIIVVIQDKEYPEYGFGQMKQDYILELALRVMEMMGLIQTH